MSKGTATEITMCGKTLKLGDYVKVKYMSGTWSKGAILSGKITEIWADNHRQARVENGWCFHDHDEIVEHVPFKED